MHEITVHWDGTIKLRDAAVLCDASLDAMHKRLRRGLLREVRREKGHILLYLLDVARMDAAMAHGEPRDLAEVSWVLEGEPDVDILSVFRACERIAAQLAGPLVRDPVVYYVRFADRIKIGTTICLRGRIDTLPHDEILATEPGGAEVERERHMQFAEYWITGEWFRAGPLLLRHVADLAEKYPLPAA